MRDDCCAVVVNYRCADLTTACVASLREHAPELPVIVVENGSGDGSAERLSRVPGAEVLAYDDNAGFGGGCNRGIEHALARFPALEHVLLLNPDAVVTAGFLDALRNTAARQLDSGVIGGRILSADGRTVLFENGRYRRNTLTRSHVPAPKNRPEFETEFVTGALMFVSADLLRDGLRFDERYFLYMEDMDLCRQVRAARRTLWINLDAVIHHHEGGSQRDQSADAAGLRPDQLRYLTRNKVLFARKWLGPVRRTVFYVVAFLFKPLAGVLRFRSVRFLPLYYRALLEGLRLGD